MLEAQRLQYLSVLGVDNYVPRRQLAGAAPSVLLGEEYFQSAEQLDVANVEKTVNDEIAHPQQETTEIESSQLPSSTNSVEEREVAAESLLTDLVKEKQAEPVAAASHTEAASAAIRFTLSVWRVQDLLILDSRQPGAALPTDRLLQNMLRVIGYSLAQLPSSETVRWPLFSGKNISVDQQQDADQARAMVQAYISAQQSKQSLQTIILMGEESLRFALNGEYAFTETVGKVLSESPWELPVIILPSLVSLLHEPLQKTVAWQALQTIS